MFEEIRQDILSFGELFSYSWLVFKKNFALIALMILLIFIPIALFIPTGLSNIILDLYREINLKQAQSQLFSFYLLMIIMNMFSMMIVILMTENTIRGESLKFKAVLIKCMHRFIPLIITGIIEAIFIFILILCFVIPFIIVGPMILLTSQAVILRDRFGTGAIKHSISLTKKKWGRVFLICLLFMCVNWLLDKICIPINSEYAGVIFTGVLDSFVKMFFYILNTVLFLNLDYFHSPLGVFSEPIVEPVAPTVEN